MEDRQIVDLYLARDEEAIKRTSEKYGARIRNIANGILGDPQSAEEVVSRLFRKFSFDRSAGG